jgi:hypothetical protein
MKTASFFRLDTIYLWFFSLWPRTVWLRHIPGYIKLQFKGARFDTLKYLHTAVNGIIKSISNQWFEDVIINQRVASHQSCFLHSGEIRHHSDVNCANNVADVATNSCVVANVQTLLSYKFCKFKTVLWIILIFSDCIKKWMDFVIMCCV